MKFAGKTLEEAVLQALFTNKANDEGKGGFWGNSLIKSEPSSTLWQFYPKPATRENITGAKRAIEEALYFMVQDRIASSIEVKYQSNAFLIIIKKDQNLSTLRIPWQN